MTKTEEVALLPYFYLFELFSGSNYFLIVLFSESKREVIRFTVVKICCKLRNIE